MRQVKEEFSDAYWSDFWSWYNRSGIWHVVAYLAVVDLDGFAPKTPPRKPPYGSPSLTPTSPPRKASSSMSLKSLEWPDAVIIGKRFSAPTLSDAS